MSLLTQWEVEHRRALARRILSLDATNPVIQSALAALLTLDYLAASAREGILIVGHASAAPEMRSLVQQLQQKGLSTYLKLVGEAPLVHANFEHIGVVVLIYSRTGLVDSDMHECYERAMALGKVVVPVLSCDDTLPDLFFDLPPLYVEHDLSELVERLAAMFASAVPC